MTYGLKNWNKKNTYYIQTNNAIENILKKEDGKDWLESCGPTSVINILASQGKDFILNTKGVYNPQPEDILTLYFHDFRNYTKFKSIRKEINYNQFFNNRIPQLYPIALKEVFNIKAKFKWGKPSTKELIENLKNNIGFILCLKNPGHYISIVAFNDKQKEVIYNNSTN